MIDIVKLLEGRSNADRKLKIIELLKERGFDFKIQKFRTFFRGKGENIIVDIGAGDKTIVISGHYDAHPESPGANDNASAVAIMIETMDELWELGLSHKLKFIFFDREESNLLGSKYFVKNNTEDIRGVFNLEMVGRGKHFALWSLHGGEEFQSLFFFEQKLKERKLNFERLPRLLRHNADHASFQKAKLEAFSITTLNDKELELARKFREIVKGKKRLNKKQKEEIKKLMFQAPLLRNYHNQYDTSEKLSQEDMERVEDVLVDAIIEMDRPNA